MSIVHFVLALRLPFHSGNRNAGRPTFRQLHVATENLDRALIVKLLRRGVDPDIVDSNGDTVLHLAFKRLYNDSNDLQSKLVKVLEVYLEACGMSVHRMNRHGETVLYLAVKKRLDQVTRFLVRQGARFDVTDYRGNTTLHFVVNDEFDKFSRDCSPDGDFKEERVFKPEEDFIKWVLSKTTNVDCKNFRGTSPLSLAAERNLLHVMLVLLKYTKDVIFVDKKGRTIFHIFLESIAHFNSYDQLDEGIPTFCYEERYVTEIVKLMLEKGFSIDAADKNGDVPILMALKNRQTELVRLMLEHPINSLKKEGDEMVDGLSLVQLAIINKDLRVVQCLKENGVDFNVRYRGNNLLHLLSTNTIQLADNSIYEVMVDLLVNEGCDVNARNDKSMTPLHLASQAGIFPVVKRLIEYGANVHSRELAERRFTPLHEAIDNNRAGLIEVLVNAGADINARTVKGQTPLHLAMLYESDMVGTLLRLGAYVDVQDDEGRAPLYDAISYHNIIAIKELLNFGVDINDCGICREITNLSEIGSVMSTMLEHWVKLQAAGLPAANYYRYQVVNRSFLGLYNECFDEAQGLRDCLFNDGTSMYELLHMNPNRRCTYMAMRKMKDSLLSRKLEKLFPKYHTIIKACYQEATARYSLLEPAKCAWYELTEISLPEACVDQILSYLNNMTLRVMVSGLKDKSLRGGSYDFCW